MTTSMILATKSTYEWIDTLFDWCVQVITNFGKLFGMNYNEANIVIFCIVWPLLFLYFMALSLINLKYKNKTTRYATKISIAVVVLSIPILWILTAP